MYNFSFAELRGVRTVVLWSVLTVLLSGVYLACAISKDPKIGDCYQVGRFHAKVTKPLQYGAYVAAYIGEDEVGRDYVPYFAMQRIDCYWDAKK